MDPVMRDALLASLHHLAVFALVAVVVAELVLASAPALDLPRLRQLGRLDSAYGALAVVVLLIGGARVVHGLKGWAFYSGNPMFWAKLGAFAAVGLLSIVPTVRILRWRKAGKLPDAAALASLRGWLWGEVLLLALIPIFAVLMARGVGR